MSRVNLLQVNYPPTQVTPNLAIPDAAVAFWVQQVSLRLRREMAWCWHQRAQMVDPRSGVLPPLTDVAAENLDYIRFENEKRQFFKNDPAAQYLSDHIAQLQPVTESHSESSWNRAVENLGLDDASQFVLAMGLAARFDSGLGPIMASCMNDLSRPFPTLALAQRLWDQPYAIIATADPGHPLYRYGFLANINEMTTGGIWQRPLEVPAVVAAQLADPAAPLPWGALLLRSRRKRELDSAGELLVAYLQANVQRGMRVVPMLGPNQSAFDDWVCTLGERLDRQVVAVDDRASIGPRELLAMACVCWIRGQDMMLSEQWLQDKFAEKMEILLAAQSIPVQWYLPLSDQSRLAGFPVRLVTPPLTVPGLTFQERVEQFKQGLGVKACTITQGIEECSRRFRFQEQTIDRVTRIFDKIDLPLTHESLAAACAGEANIELGNLAQRVLPRFMKEELVLPNEQMHQFDDILLAMQTLTVVHYRWGTAKAWNESGIAVLFCGAPGTGKTMAAEVLATALNLPMYRVDLSQVVNKYIGETEKNLKRIFDAAELSDCVLLFDEADALFGKRTEVKDAHDRFANIEISYLLERMERFKGLAILATNRRKDLDDAFLRRLRFIIEFPIPGVSERKQIWQLVFPSAVDVSELDFNYLAKQFHLSGGHIRSIAFNACLRAAGTRHSASGAKVLMDDLLVAVKRELEKLSRTASDEQFGVYSNVIKERSI